MHYQYLVPLITIISNLPGTNNNVASMLFIYMHAFSVQLPSF